MSGRSLYRVQSGHKERNQFYLDRGAKEGFPGEVGFDLRRKW